ncbi:MAG: hypothetical protein ACI81W_003179, partial [Saprospiraceae bacterium]
GLEFLGTFFSMSMIPIRREKKCQKNYEMLKDRFLSRFLIPGYRNDYIRDWWQDLKINTKKDWDSTVFFF